MNVNSFPWMSPINIQNNTGSLGYEAALVDKRCLCFETGFIFKSQKSILNWSQDDTLVRMHENKVEL